MMSKRILLNEEDFKKLTKGEILEKDGIEIALSDIGFYNMLDSIYKTERKTHPSFLRGWDVSD
jgi:hypothetical protein